MKIFIAPKWNYGSLYVAIPLSFIREFSPSFLFNFKLSRARDLRNNYGNKGSVLLSVDKTGE